MAFKVLLNGIFICLLALLGLSGSSCRHPGAAPDDKPVLPLLNSIALVGFRPALSPAQSPGMVRSPISGAVFTADPVSEEIAKAISVQLFEKLTKDSPYQWVSPLEAASAFSRIASSHPQWTDREVYLEIAKALSADAVLGGHVYRWSERQGTDYAASHPASVAFDIYLMTAADGILLWKARFDKTQISLSENILDLKTFLKAKGRWLTAHELAEIGLREFADSFPKGEKAKE